MTWNSRAISVRRSSFTSFRKKLPSTSMSRLSPQLRTTLNDWCISVPRQCLDLRTAEAYAHGHLIPSTSIPLDTLETRFSQLPPKTTNESFLLVIEKGMIFNGQPVDELLRGRGWYVSGVIKLPPDKGREFWEYALEKKVFGTNHDGAQLLFRPSPLLSTWIDHIEEDLLSNGTSTASALDIGCGSGRDLGFLTSRNYPWHVNGLDNWEKALSRTKELITSIAPAKLSSLIHARIEDSGDISVLLPNSTEYELFSLHGNISVILVIRYFPRYFFTRIHQYLRPGGYLLFSHFTDPEDVDEEYKSPPGDRRVSPGEVENLLSSSSAEWEFLETMYTHSEDSRPMWNVVARWGA
jgi:SAM-dependent methyltransferase